jgi:excisionase family DNA binding protein
MKKAMPRAPRPAPSAKGQISQLERLTYAAARLGVSSSTVYRLARAGRLPGAVRVGGGWRINKDVLEEWVATS